MLAAVFADARKRAQQTGIFAVKMIRYASKELFDYPVHRRYEEEKEYAYGYTDAAKDDDAILSRAEDAKNRAIPSICEMGRKE
jgi:hypothetical protein